MKLCPRYGVFQPCFKIIWASFVVQLVKNPPTVWEIWVWSLSWEDPLEKGKANHSSVLAWRVPWAVQFMESQRVGHDQATFTSTAIFWVQIHYNFKVYKIQNIGFETSPRKKKCPFKVTLLTHWRISGFFPVIDN